MLAGQVEGDVIPVMRSLGSVAPDVHDLLDLTRELNAMLAKLPGMGRIKKRVDEQQAADERPGPDGRRARPRQRRPAVRRDDTVEMTARTMLTPHPPSLERATGPAPGR